MPGVAQPPQPQLTEAYVAEILKRKKFVHAVVSDNTRPSVEDKRKHGHVSPNEKRIVYEVRFADMPDKPAHLRFTARIETGISGAPRPRPGFSLQWKGIRIRGVNHNWRHDSLRHGVSCGHIRKWHEKIWTNTDGDKYAIDINSEIKNTNMVSMIRFCCKRWNIELQEQFELGEEQ